MPKVQNQAKGLYEVIWHLSDLNYMMKVLRTKEIVEDEEVFSKDCLVTNN
jgi:hypothetical protein